MPDLQAAAVRTPRLPTTGARQRNVLLAALEGRDVKLPRVRVKMRGPGRIAGRLVAEYRCEACGRGGWNDHPTVVRLADDHARTCAALRLALLLDRITELRDAWRAVGKALVERDDTPYSRTFIYRADDLDRLIAEATR